MRFDDIDVPFYFSNFCLTYRDLYLYNLYIKGLFLTFPLFTYINRYISVLTFLMKKILSFRMATTGVFRVSVPLFFIF